MNYLTIMEPNDSALCSQQPVTGVSSDSIEFTPQYHVQCNISCVGIIDLVYVLFFKLALETQMVTQTYFDNNLLPL
jgi:hypothetical protein